MTNSMPRYAYKLLEIARTTIDLKFADFRSLWQWFYRDTLLTLDVERPIYWVIDGLGEADSPASILRLLSDLNTAIVPLRIFIPGRKMHDISSAFTRLGRQVCMEAIWLTAIKFCRMFHNQAELGLKEEADRYDATNLKWHPLRA